VIVVLVREVVEAVWKLSVAQSIALLPTRARLSFPS
jgi:hypothetical protein